MKSHALVFTVGMSFALASSSGLAAEASKPPPSDPVKEVLSSQHGYGCCAGTIAACLASKPSCPLAPRLESAVRKMVAAGMTREAIAARLSARAQAMDPAAPQTTSLQDPRFEAGDPSAPVVLTLYACGRSKDCAELVPALYRAVTGGRLKGKARLFLRPFFGADNEAAQVCGRALVAAASQARFWRFLMTLYDNQENFQRCMLRKWADLEGLDQCAFQAAYDHADTTAYLEAARREGVQNHVDTVPAAFLDGRRVRSLVTAEDLIDLAEESFEQRSAQGAPAPGPVAR